MSSGTAALRGCENLRKNLISFVENRMTLGIIVLGGFIGMVLSD
jgi:hypothetical protein